MLLFVNRIRFYCRAIKLSSSDLSLWYELSLNYLNRSIKYGTDETRRKYLELAAATAKHIIKGAPQKWKYWNLLGVICVTKGRLQSILLNSFLFLFALILNDLIRFAKFAAGTALFHQSLGIGSKVGCCMDKFGMLVFDTGSDKNGKCSIQTGSTI